MQDAQKKADALQKKYQESLVTEEANLRKAFKRRAQHEVLSTTRKVLENLAGVSLEERVVEVFAQRLRDLDASQKLALTSALGKETDAAIVRTALAPTPTQRISVEHAIREIIGSQPAIVFESAPALISGIELGINGQKVAWSVDDYLTTLDDGFENLLKEDSR